MSKAAKKKPGGKSQSATTGLEGGMSKLSVGGSLFPMRPQAEATKGRPVKLIVNLFKLSLQANQPLTKYHVMLEPPPKPAPPEGTTVKISTSKPSDSKTKTKVKPGGDSTTPLADTEITKKIPPHIRRRLVDDAIKKWATARGKKRDQVIDRYVYDGISSIFTLFDLFEGNESAGGNWFEADVDYEDQHFSGDKMENVTRTFKVKLGYKQKEGIRIDLKILADYCSGKRIPIEQVQPAIQALNIVISNNLAISGKFVGRGTNMFNPRPDDFYLGNGLRMNSGFYFSARPVKSGMVLNVANTAAAFYDETSLIDLLCKRVAEKRRQPQIDIVAAFGEAARDKSIWEQFEKDIRQKQIEARHKGFRGSNGSMNYRKYRVIGLGNKSAGEHKFTLVDRETNSSNEVTIRDYFLKEHKAKLKYPQLPCIQVGSLDKSVYLPMEVCHMLERQTCRRKLDPKETSEFIKKAATKPDIHFDKILNNVRQISDSGKGIYRTFGINIGTDPITVNGRELEPTKIKIGGNKSIIPFDGQYRMQNERFLKPVVINRWVFAVCTPPYNDRDQPDPMKFVQNFMRAAQSLGVSVVKPPAMKNINKTDWDNKKFWSTNFISFLENNKVEFIMIVLPNPAPDWLYQLIKLTEAKSAIKLKKDFIRTQCIKYENFKKGIGFNRPPDQSLLSNLWLKANEKLGGNNITLQCSGISQAKFDSKVLYVGIDVSHPAPGDALSRSVVAAVGMWDITGNVGYHTVLRVQQTRNEESASQVTIEHVEKAAEMLKEIVESYRRHKNVLPNHILILRDGVSEGQFNIVHNLELNKILLYVEKLEQKPKVTYVVVQKRHKIRFRLAQRGRNDRDDNIHPGTVVDRDVIHPSDHDFYLAPHKAIQGTSRPAHYYALHDELGYSQDDLQEISHALCYMSPRCNRAISIPTPVYLADLAAERGRNLVIAQVAMQPGGRGMTRENVDDLNQFFCQLPTEYSNRLFYN